MEEAWEQYELQNGKCALTGLSLIFGFGRKDASKQNASLDRIDNNIGYAKGNIQWIHKRINVMKSNLSQYDFIGYCTLVAETTKQPVETFAQGLDERMFKGGGDRRVCTKLGPHGGGPSLQIQCIGGN